MGLNSFIYSIFFICIGYLPGWGQTQVIQQLGPAQYRVMMQKIPAKTVLDVRTAQETATGIIPGAIEIDFLAPDFSRQLTKLDKTKPVFVYCAVGGRSAKAMQQMQQAGFKTVYNLTGGLGAWHQAGYPVVKKKP